MTVQPTSAPSTSLARKQPDSLADVLERVLDKGVVIAGDVIVNVLDIELLSLKLRLFIASADTAKELGMDWWTQDPFFSSQAPRAEQGSSAREVPAGGDGELERENRELRRQIAELKRDRERESSELESSRELKGSREPKRGDDR